MRIILALAAVAVLVTCTSVGISYESGYYPDTFVNLSLDKTEYNPGDTVKVTVTASQNLAITGGNVSLAVYDVTFGNGNKTIVYQDQKPVANGGADFMFKAPMSSDRYIYLATAQYQGITNSTLFFTREGASRIVISDVKVFTQEVKQGTPLRFGAKVFDGLDNKIHNLRVWVQSNIPSVHCPDQNQGIGDNLGPDVSNQDSYWKDGTIYGYEVISPYAKPGSYNLTLTAGGETDGYQAATTTIPYEITENPDKSTPFSVMHTPIEADYDKDMFFTEQPIRIHSFTAYGSCGDRIPNVPITAEIERYDSQKARYVQTLEIKNTTSDSNGDFSILFDPVGLRTGHYDILVRPHYPGTNETLAANIQYSNTKNFTISELGKNFTVSVDGWNFIPLNATFDRQHKTLTLGLDSSDSLRRVGFTIPSELLDGKFTVLVNGQERDGDIQMHQGYASFFPWPGEDNSTKIEVIGTTAIPEFPLVAPALLIGMISLILFYRISFR